jgi:hypothetical protein
MACFVYKNGPATTGMACIVYKVGSFAGAGCLGCIRERERERDRDESSLVTLGGPPGMEWDSFWLQRLMSPQVIHILSTPLVHDVARIGTVLYPTDDASRGVLATPLRLPETRLASATTLGECFHHRWLVRGIGHWTRMTSGYRRTLVGDRAT